MIYLYYYPMKGNKMENQFIVNWQWDDNGEAGLVKCMSFDTYEEAQAFVWKQKAGTLLDRQADTIEHWVSPHFGGKVATQLRA